MIFIETIELIHKHNTNPSAKLPDSYDIIFNRFTTENGIILSPKHAELVRKSFLNESKENIKNNYWFYGCLHSVYLMYYNVGLKKYLELYVDADESDYIMEELSIGVVKLEFPFINAGDKAEIKYSLKKRFLFLRQRLNSLGYSLIYKPVHDEKASLGFSEQVSIQEKDNYKGDSTNNLNWDRSKNDLIEIISGFIETKAFGDVDDIEIIENIERSFNIDLKAYKQAESKIRKRVKDLTTFLNLMKLKIEQRKIRLEENNKANKDRN